MGANGEEVEVPSLAEQLGHLQCVGVEGGGERTTPALGRGHLLFLASRVTHNRSGRMNETWVALAVKSFPPSGDGGRWEIFLIASAGYNRARYDPAFCCFHSFLECSWPWRL